MRIPVILILSSALAAGCAAKRVTAPPSEPLVEAPRPQPKVQQTQVTATNSDDAQAPAPFNGATLHFGFDQSVLEDESARSLEQVAEAMRKNPKMQVQIAGHSDDRGTTEYNLALGSKRAEVAKRYLVTLGIDAARISTTTYGEELPAVPGQSEEAYAANRRDVIAPQ